MSCPQKERDFPLILSLTKTTNKHLNRLNRMPTENLIIPLYFNDNKMNDMQPDLVGSFTLDGKSFELADWIRTTMDRQRQYHSCLLYDAAERKAAFKDKSKCPPVSKFKLYETRKRLVTDPDFSCKEPFSLAGIVWYAALSVQDTNPEDLEALSINLTLSRQPMRQAASPEAVSSITAFRERLAQRELERQARLEEEQKEAPGESVKSRLAASIDGEPDDLPF
jgi:hypothetical protein